MNRQASKLFNVDNCFCIDQLILDFGVHLCIIIHVQYTTVLAVLHNHTIVNTTICRFSHCRYKYYTYIFEKKKEP